MLVLLCRFTYLSQCKYGNATERQRIENAIHRHSPWESPVHRSDRDAEWDVMEMIFTHAILKLGYEKFQEVLLGEMV